MGVVLKPVGLKGELKIKPVTDNPERYEPGGSLWADDPKRGLVELVISSVSEHKGNFKVRFEGVNSIEDAEALRALDLYVPESEVPPLPEGEFYYFQLQGLEVYSASGRLLGTVADIISAGEKDVFIVKDGGREHLIPYTEEHVRSIDLDTKRIDLYPMEGYIS